jgi:hypothetical protein
MRNLMPTYVSISLEKELIILLLTRLQVETFRKCSERKQTKISMHVRGKSAAQKFLSHNRVTVTGRK